MASPSHLTCLQYNSLKRTQTCQPTHRVVVKELEGRMLLWFSLSLLKADVYQALSSMGGGRIQLCAFYPQRLSASDPMSSTKHNCQTTHVSSYPATMSLFPAQLLVKKKYIF